MDKLICIYRTFDTFKANLIKAYFDNEDVFCFIKTNDASGTLPHLGLVQGGIEIMVYEDDLDISQKILGEMDQEN